MADTESTSNSSSQMRKGFYCPGTPNFIWNLNDTTFAWILVVVRGTASPCIVLANILVIIAMNTNKVLQKQSTILLSSLAITDLLTGAVILPFSTAIDVLMLRQVLLANICTIKPLYACLGFFLGLCSLYHLTVIAWERDVAIRKWMDYKVIVKISRVRKLAIAGWLATFFLTAPIPVLQSAGVDHNVTEGWYIAMHVPATVFLILIVYFYVMVYLGVRKQRKINEMNQVNALIKAKFQSKIAKTTFLLTAVLIVSHVPLGVVLVLGKTFPVLRTNMAVRSAETLVQLNSIFNPVLYCFRNRRFRTAVLELLRMKKPQTIQEAVGAKRSVRKRSSRGSKEDVLEMRKAEKGRRLFRSKSCNPSLAVDYHRNNEIMLTRTLSFPMLHNNSLDNQLFMLRQQGSTFLRTTATAHGESDVRHEKRQSCPDLPKDGQTTIHGRLNIVGNVPRSKSWDAGESAEFLDRCFPNLQEKNLSEIRIGAMDSSERSWLMATHRRNLDLRQDNIVAHAIMNHSLNSKMYL